VENKPPLKHSGQQFICSCPWSRLSWVIPLLVPPATAVMIQDGATHTSGGWFWFLVGSPFCSHVAMEEFREGKAMSKDIAMV
jgi:hypothetical protein